jgi:hypothetical protein
MTDLHLILDGLMTDMLFNDANELAKSLFALLFTPRGPSSRRRMSDHMVETFSSPAMR